jgi:hypothetical protein
MNARRCFSTLFCRMSSHLIRATAPLSIPAPPPDFTPTLRPTACTKAQPTPLPPISYSGYTRQ